MTVKRLLYILFSLEVQTSSIGAFQVTSTPQATSTQIKSSEKKQKQQPVSKVIFENLLKMFVSNYFRGKVAVEEIVKNAVFVVLTKNAKVYSSKIS